jgi:hypothetical protein
MSIEFPKKNMIGSCLDLRAALMNHSCDPNTAFFFKGPELRIRLTEIIPIRKKITILYIDFIESFNFRQK